MGEHNTYENTKSMEMVLTEADLEARNGLWLPAGWPEELHHCFDGAQTKIELVDRVVPNLRWIFVMRRGSPPEPSYSFLRTAWKDFVNKKQLRVGDKIVIEVVEKRDLNLSLRRNVVVAREYTIKAQRKGSDSQWVDIPPHLTRKNRIW